MTDGVYVEGLDKLVRAMKRAGEDITELKDAHTRAAQIVASAASAMAPRDTGRLSNSIRPAKQVKRARVMAGGARVRYAGPIHWGWPKRNIRPDPFLSNAAQRTETQWVARYLEDIQAALDKVKAT